MEVVYGGNAIQHMMTGKSLQRAFRGHLLVDRCLNYLVVSDLLKDNTQFESLIDQVEDTYSSLVVKEITLESAVASDMLIKIKHMIDMKQSEISTRSTTSQLWISYQRMLLTPRSLIRADHRTLEDALACSI
ncbi:hypothetical protein Pcinc_006468 [Petrolisthes cinctipes]|uniref:Uncharacterized protein n=1 Tax=Petrolisthes cinctipes TaxID=88211 RepID=A0AAE1GCR5_PETCI|nr:hypothetical protein Pcinc_006468 [Petrolisthes cinctipes]